VYNSEPYPNKPETAFEFHGKPNAVEFNALYDVPIVGAVKPPLTSAYEALTFKNE
jgi:hypothetical protein